MANPTSMSVFKKFQEAHQNWGLFSPLSIKAIFPFLFWLHSCIFQKFSHQTWQNPFASKTRGRKAWNLWGDTLSKIAISKRKDKFKKNPNCPDLDQYHLLLTEITWCFSAFTSSVSRPKAEIFDTLMPITVLDIALLWEMLTSSTANCRLLWHCVRGHNFKNCVSQAEGIFPLRDHGLFILCNCLSPCNGSSQSPLKMTAKEWNGLPIRGQPVRAERKKGKQSLSDFLDEQKGTNEIDFPFC